MLSVGIKPTICNLVIKQVNEKAVKARLKLGGEEPNYEL